MKLLAVEEFDLGKPTCPKISINGDWQDSIPHAYNRDGNWFYNFAAAVLEARFLHKKLPSRLQWKKILETSWCPREYKGCIKGNEGQYEHIGSLLGKGEFAYYWSSSYSKENLSQISVTVISKANTYIDRYPITFGLTVRCLKD